MCAGAFFRLPAGLCPLLRDQQQLFAGNIRFLFDLVGRQNVRNGGVVPLRHLPSRFLPAEIPQEQSDALNRSHIIGKSQGLTDVLNTIARIARTNASVLITGESGTGKELIAEAIHINSQRAKQPFIKVNLGGISQSLFESEMFGHKKGAFTDASADRIGRFEMANKGTIFLDEIGDLDPSCQVKLLRVLQDQTFEVLGDSRPRKTDIRVVSATNADLSY